MVLSNWPNFEDIATGITSCSLGLLEAARLAAAFASGAAAGVGPSFVPGGSGAGGRNGHGENCNKSFVEMDARIYRF